MKTLMNLLLLGLVALAVVAFVAPLERCDGPGRAEDRPSRHARLARGPFRPRPARTPAVDVPDVREIAGRVSATPERARADARRQLGEDVRDWLAPEVPASWTPPAAQVDAMIRQVRVAPEEKDYGTVFTAVIDADFGSVNRACLVGVHRRDAGRDRALKLAAALGFVLVCLASVTGYIRADEATRGYYTSRLRLVAAAAVGGSAVALGQFLARS